MHSSLSKYFLQEISQCDFEDRYKVVKFIGWRISASTNGGAGGYRQ